jgi:hypothetical protein
VYNERGKSKDLIRERKNYPVEGCLHDMVSVLYKVRNADFSALRNGQSFPVTLFVDKEQWPLDVRFQGREPNFKVKGLGKFNTLKITPEVISGKVFPEGAELNVWVTDDANRLPLMIESPLSVGSAKAVLTGYKGLRHPVSAKRN